MYVYVCLHACVTWTGTIILLGIIGFFQKRIFQKRD